MSGSNVGEKNFSTKQFGQNGATKSIDVIPEIALVIRASAMLEPRAYASDSSGEKQRKKDRLYAEPTAD